MKKKGKMDDDETLLLLLLSTPIRSGGHQQRGAGFRVSPTD
jgi:hypothetical protein